MRLISTGSKNTTSRELSGSTASKLIEAELALLMAFARRLNDISSKGVHADVSAAEAKQGLVGPYMFLFNLVSPAAAQKLTEVSATEAKNGRALFVMTMSGTPAVLLN